MPVPEDLINEIQYLVQRSQFINPVHLPTLTESFLAKDFDFGEYTAIKLGNTIEEHFKLHFVTLIFTLPLLAACFYLVGSNGQLHVSTVIQLSSIGIFILLVAVLTLVRLDLNRIQRQLFPQIKLDEQQMKQDDPLGDIAPPLVQPEGLNLHQSLEKADMFSPYDELPLPQYLTNAEVRSVNNYIMSADRLDTLSKHEKLFTFSRGFISIVLQIVQFSLIVCSTLVFMALGNELFYAENMTFMGVAILLVHVFILTVAYKLLQMFIPVSLCTYALATSTEMMKDRSAIDTVILKQKIVKNERNYRIFQAMRLMRREYMKMLLVDEQIVGKNLKEITVQ